MSEIAERVASRCEISSFVAIPHALTEHVEPERGRVNGGVVVGLQDVEPHAVLLELQLADHEPAADVHADWGRRHPNDLRARVVYITGYLCHPCMWLIYLRVGRQEPDQQTEQADDVLLELLDAVGTPAVDVPKTAVVEDQVQTRAPILLRVTLQPSVNLSRPHSGCKDIIDVDFMLFAVVLPWFDV